MGSTNFLFSHKLYLRAQYDIYPRIFLWIITHADLAFSQEWNVEMQYLKK